MAYYNGNSVIDNARPFNFVIGNRSAGKSFFWKRYMIKNFLETGKKSFYLRRYKDDIKIHLPHFFDDLHMIPEFSEMVYTTKAGAMFIDGEMFAQGLGLTEITKFKSFSGQDFSLAMFDEFLPEDGKFLNNATNMFYESQLLMNFYISVARGYKEQIRDDFQIVCISNSTNLYNPYFEFFGVKFDKGTKKFKSKSCFAELYINESAKNAINDKLSDLVQRNAEYFAHVTDNKSLNETDIYIEDKPKEAKYMFGMCTNTDFSVWQHKGIAYIREGCDNNREKYSILENDALQILPKQAKIMLQNALLENRLRYSNQRVKTIFHELLWRGIM